jgi:hypothetical protein
MLSDGVLDSAHAAAARIAERMPLLGASRQVGRASAVVKTRAARDPGRAA